MKRYVLISVLLSAVVIAAMSHPTSAESTVVTRICDEAQGASVTITSPASDSLVDDPTIALTGTVSQSNQLEVLVDDAFNGVVPLDSSASTYSTQVQLPVGTHKITVTATDACQVQNATQSIVVTYQPAQAPSTGVDVSTSVSEKGGTVGVQQAQVESVMNQAPPTVVGQYIAPILNNIARALDLQSLSAANATSSTLTNMIRFIMVVMGLVMLLMAGPIVAAVSGWLALAGVSVATKRQKYTRRAIRSIGIMLILFVFIF
ncbi:MAG: hypothetical protein JWM07_935 [Candidatus Saccharibacteria bacterium]|nr:hypothetical protein [Candidatus Saccharibacteria bacterium]